MFFAFAHYNDSIHINGLQNEAHGFCGFGIGCVPFVAVPVARGDERGGFRCADEFQ